MLYMRRGRSLAMKDRRERETVNWEGREDESTSVSRGGLLIKKGLGKPVYALFGRSYDCMELTNVHFSRIP